MAETREGRTPKRKREGQMNTPRLRNRTALRNRIRSIAADDHPWTTETSRKSPLPELPWGDHRKIWQTMIYKEEATCRVSNQRQFEDPSSLLPYMRAILMDWLMEVCEVFGLRRVTYYLAVDYVDRYLNLNPTIPKHRLQLIGITSLFIAAKVEEINSPKLYQFSYVCDGACSPDEVLDCELVLLKALNWDMTPMTLTDWLSLYMQIEYNSKKLRSTGRDLENNFYYAHYSPLKFVQASHLIDLFSLDPGFLSYNYSVIAAGAMFFIFNRATALQVSGLSWNDLQACIEYMAVFYGITTGVVGSKLQTVMIRDEVDVKTQATFNSIKVWAKNVTCSDDHLLQGHDLDLDYFVKASLFRLFRMGFRVRESADVSTMLENTQQSVDSDETDPNHQVEDDNQDENSDCELVHVMYGIDGMPLGNDSDLIDSYADDPAFEFSSSKSQCSFEDIMVGLNESN